MDSFLKCRLITAFPRISSAFIQAQERSKNILLQLDKQEEEAALREIMLQEEVDELTIELSEERKALRYSEMALRNKERDLEEVLGGYNEKGEELELLTAKVSNLLPFPPTTSHSV